MRILISNDDGYFAPGIEHLASALREHAQITVVAPERDRSGASNSLTLDRPLQVRRAPNGFLFVNGTPTDCVHVAVTGLLDELPDMVVSGINLGANMGDDTIYSGTVAAAMEGSLLNVPAIAFSLVARQRFDFGPAAHFARALVAAALARELPRRLLLNVNVPSGAPRPGYQVTRLGQHRYGADVVEKLDPRGRRYYWIGGTGYEHVSEAGTDVTAVLDQGQVSVTPIKLDLTDGGGLEAVRGWALEGFEQTPT